MEATQKDNWYFMVLLIVFSLCKETILKRPVDSTVKLQKDMTLKCVCPWRGNLSMVSWEKRTNKGKEQVAVYHTTFGTTTKGRFNGRVTFVNSLPLDGSIIINQTTDDDLGFYHCSIQTFPGGSWSKNILVENAGNFITTKSETEAVVEKGHNFTLNCRYNQNGTVYHVAFEKIGEKSKDTIVFCNFSDAIYIGSDYKNRILFDCSSALHASILITNITEEDGGIYQCHFSTETGNQTTTVSLNGPKWGKNTFIYIGAAAAGIVVLIIVATSVSFLHRRKKKLMRVKFQPGKRRQHNKYEPAAVYDKMKRRPKQQEMDDIYINLPNQPRRTKKK
ncbi:CD226 antigen isoform X2 [Amia ocellicauda]|uniref:CD226 antigen isoform X2 n=1 Tax=Amia ocellicauda TaxID=2972642 RepID=UPI003464D159